MNNVKGDEVRRGEYIYLDALSKDRIASTSDEPLSEAMLSYLHDNTSALQPMSARDAVEKVKEQGRLKFAICLNHDQSCIGACSLNDVEWQSLHAQLKIAIVDETYHTSDMLADVIQTVLQFVYWEANLNRIYIYCPSDYTLLQSALDDCQFVNEGRLRQEIYRNGDYHDLLIYSILQRDWSRLNVKHESE